MGMNVAKIGGMNPIMMGFGTVAGVPGARLSAAMSNLTISEVDGEELADAEMEASLKLDDSIGRAFDQVYDYQAPAMPNFAVLAGQGGAGE